MGSVTKRKGGPEDKQPRKKKKEEGKRKGRKRKVIELTESDFCGHTVTKSESSVGTP